MYVGSRICVGRTESNMYDVPREKVEKGGLCDERKQGVPLFNNYKSFDPDQHPDAEMRPLQRNISVLHEVPGTS
jgi:hypothetical protein